MEVAVRNQSGETVHSIELNDAVFNVPMNKTLVHQALVIYQGNRRQGTHDTKTRSEVSGGGRKPWIQKHTGRARQGSTRSPQWRHGGVVFGPHPRSYRKSLPKRMKRAALRCVLSDKARNDRVVCLDSMDTIDGRTRSMAGLLERLNVSGSALIVTMGTDRNVVQAASNLKRIYTLPVNQLNAETLLSKDTLILTEEAARWAAESLAAEPHGRRGRKFATGDNDAGIVASEVEQVTEQVTEEEEPVAEPTVSEESELTEVDEPEADTEADSDEDGE